MCMGHAAELARKERCREIQKSNGAATHGKGLQKRQHALSVPTIAQACLVSEQKVGR